MIKIILVLLLILTNQLIALETGKVTGYKIPRFVSLKFDEVNLRIGPSKNYPIKIKYIQQNFPIEIIDEYDVWRQIKDINENIGWIHRSLLKGERHAIISSKKFYANVFNYPSGKYIGKIGNNNIIELKKCIQKWCLIKSKEKKGWVNKNDIWGVYKKETYNIGFFQPIININWKIKKFLDELKNN